MAKAKKSKSKTKVARKAASKGRLRIKHRSCPECGKPGFNGRTHPHHLPKEERSYNRRKPAKKGKRR